MTEDVELMFNSGSIVAIKTCYNHTIEGEVIAFDYNKKVLLLKCPANSGHSSMNNVHLINLDYAKDVQIKKDVKREECNVTQLPHLNIAKVEERARTAINERKRLASAFNAGITEEGLKVFLSLAKTMGNVTWEGKCILVMNNVLIQPPYKAENCTPYTLPGRDRNPLGTKQTDAVNYIQKLVSKYWSDVSNKEPVDSGASDGRSLSQQQPPVPQLPSQQNTGKSHQINKKTVSNKNGSAANSSDRSGLAPATVDGKS